MRLTIITGTPAVRDADGGAWVNHSNGRVFDLLRARFPGARIAIPIVPKRTSAHNHRLQFRGDEITALPPLTSTATAQRHIIKTAAQLAALNASTDVFFVRYPFQLPQALVALLKPAVIHVVGNTVAVTAASSDHRGLTRLLARSFAHVTDLVLRGLGQRPRTHLVVNGREMLDRMRPRSGEVVVSSTLMAEEISPLQHRPLGEPPRVLFVGYLRPEKGADVLLRAFEHLRSRMRAKLTLVGDTDRFSTGVEAQIAEQASAHRFAADIERHGTVAFGPALFELFRTHDVFVLPSRSEGTPRTLIEARAMGCPVIASHVGGVPDSVSDGENGVLVPPNDPRALAGAIERLFSDDERRQRLIRAGYAYASANTVERFGATLGDAIARVARGSA